MKTSPDKFFYTCPQCSHEFEVTAWPLIAAITDGPPENCSPEEGGEIEPNECPECNKEIDSGTINEMVSDRYDSAWIDTAERDINGNHYE